MWTTTLRLTESILAATLPLAELARPGELAYLAVLLLLVPFGVHRLYLVWLRLRHPPRPAPSSWPGRLPRVTVQLPVYDEARVVARLIDAACRLDYPRDRLEVQVLDDSRDHTSRIAAGRVAAWRARGVDVRHHRRDDREGYKAGALAAGTACASGEFLLVLDADFVPDPDLIRRLLPSFSDPGVGVVQAAWSHLNEDHGWLTRAQAVLLDAHFAVEHEARCRAGLFLNFNGTAGMWRRECLEAAGGWQWDTVTEDLDLSYRAQLAGWRCEYRDDVRVAGELPVTLRALEVQQERWAEGGIQTARKLLPAVWGSGERLRVKLEATAHLLGHLAHPLTLLLGFALGVLGLFSGGAGAVPDSVHLLGFSLAFVPFVLFYGLALRLRERSWRQAVPRLLQALTLGIGLGVPLTPAVARGAIGRAEVPFRRTPKWGWSVGPLAADGYALPLRPGPAVVRLGLGATLVAALLRVAGAGMLSPLPFLLLFAAGYLVTSGAALRPEPVADQ